MLWIIGQSLFELSLYVNYVISSMGSAVYVLMAGYKSLCLEPLKDYLTLYWLHETNIKRLHICPMKKSNERDPTQHTISSLTKDFVALIS